MIGDPFVEKGDVTTPASTGSSISTMADTVIIEGESPVAAMSAEVDAATSWATDTAVQPTTAAVGAIGGLGMHSMQGSRPRTTLTVAGSNQSDVGVRPTNPFQFNRLSTMWTPATNSDQVLLRRSKETGRDNGWGDSVRITELQETVKQLEESLKTQRELIKRQNESFAEIQSNYANHLADLTNDTEALKEREKRRENLRPSDVAKASEVEVNSVAVGEHKKDVAEGKRATKSLEAEIKNLKACLSEERGKRLDAELRTRLADVATSEDEELEEVQASHGGGDHKFSTSGDHGIIDGENGQRGNKRRTASPSNSSSIRLGATRRHIRSASSESNSDRRSEQSRSPSRTRRERRRKHRRSSSTGSVSPETHAKDRLPKFNPDANDQWREYHAIFERTADRRKWSPEQRLDKLILLLDGTARSVFFYNKQASYYELVKALDEMYNPSGSRSAAYFTFRNRKMGAKEPIEKYVGDLRRLAKEAYPDMDPKSLDSTIAHQFLDGIRGDPEMYQHVAMCDQTDLVQVRAGAERWRNFKTGATTGPAAPITTHTSSVNVVFNGNSKGKDKDKKKSKGGKDKRKAGNKPDYNCHYCDKKGHSWKDCWKMAEENPNWKPKRKNNNRGKKNNKWQDNRYNNRDSRNSYDSRPRSRERYRSDTPERRYRSSSRNRSDRRDRRSSPYDSRRRDDRARVNQVGDERSRDEERSREN